MNAKLANDVGNLLNRSLNVLKKNCDGVAPLDTASIPEVTREGRVLLLVLVLRGACSGRGTAR